MSGHLSESLFLFIYLLKAVMEQEKKILLDPLNHILTVINSSWSCSSVHSSTHQWFLLLNDPDAFSQMIPGPSCKWSLIWVSNPNLTLKTGLDEAVTCWASHFLCHAPLQTMAYWFLRYFSLWWGCLLFFMKDLWTSLLQNSKSSMCKCGPSGTEYNYKDLCRLKAWWRN